METSIPTPPPLLAAAHFSLPGPVQEISPFPGGLINSSWLLLTDGADQGNQFLLQKINRTVFQRPDLVMANVQRVTRHVLGELTNRGENQPQDHFLTLVPTHHGTSWLRDEYGETWRLYHFLQNTVAREKADDENDLFEAGRGFGGFLGLVANLPAPPLHEVIPGFHDTPSRLKALFQAADADLFGHASECAKELQWIRDHAEGCDLLVRGLAEGKLPFRTVHNDTKFSNVLLGQDTGKCVCVVDLDTVMPGTPLFDFGDMVRSMTCSGEEDETNLDNIQFQPARYQALQQGWIEGASGVLTPAELEALPKAGPILALELAARFLTDYLQGDHYFRTSHEKQNLDRARAQIRVATVTREGSLVA